MNTEAMPLKPHDHYQQQCGANPPIEEKAPFLATTTTTKTRVTRAALVLCMVAAVVYSKHFKRGRFLQVRVYSRLSVTTTTNTKSALSSRIVQKSTNPEARFDPNHDFPDDRTDPSNYT